MTGVFLKPVTKIHHRFARRMDPPLEDGAWCGVRAIGCRVGLVVDRHHRAIERNAGEQPARTRPRIDFRLELAIGGRRRSEEHTSELQSLLRNSYAVFCFHKKKKTTLQGTAAQTVEKERKQ